LAVNTWLLKKVAASIEPADPVKRISHQSRVERGISPAFDIDDTFLFSASSFITTVQNWNKK
jgi:hypothetical protein